LRFNRKGELLSPKGSQPNRVSHPHLRDQFDGVGAKAEPEIAASIGELEDGLAGSDDTNHLTQAPEPAKGKKKATKIDPSLTS
jgi:hypothetical protein